ALVIDLCPMALRADATSRLVRVAEVEKVPDLLSTHPVAIVLDGDVQDLFLAATGPSRRLGTIDNDGDSGGMSIPRIAECLSQELLGAFEVLGDFDKLTSFVYPRTLPRYRFRLRHDTPHSFDFDSPALGHLQRMQVLPSSSSGSRALR